MLFIIKIIHIDFMKYLKTPPPHPQTDDKLKWSLCVCQAMQAIHWLNSLKVNVMYKPINFKKINRPINVDRCNKSVQVFTETDRFYW